jgi:uncharacterized protein YciI
MTVTVVIYRYQGDQAVMDEVRPAHREFLASHRALLLSGPFARSEGAALVFEDEPAALESWLDDDPFWKAGLIAERIVKEWQPVLGAWRTALGL